MKELIFIVLGMVSVLATAQQMEVEDGTIVFKGEEVLQYSVDDTSEYIVKTLDDAEIITLQKLDSNTPKNPNDDFFVITFVEEEVVIESDENHYVTYKSGEKHEKNLKRLIQWLVMNDVLDSNANVDQEELEDFVDDYDKNIYTVELSKM